MRNKPVTCVQIWLYNRRAWSIHRRFQGVEIDEHGERWAHAGWPRGQWFHPKSHELLTGPETVAVIEGVKRQIRICGLSIRRQP